MSGLTSDLVRLVGLEPTTFRYSLSNCCVYQFRHRREFGLLGRNRTLDLQFRKLTLYPLSYEKMVLSVGFEPTKLHLRRVVHNPLCYESMLERTAGLEPAFSTPFTVHRFVVGVGYVRVTLLCVIPFMEWVKMEDRVGLEPT